MLFLHSCQLPASAVNPVCLSLPTASAIHDAGCLFILSGVDVEERPCGETYLLEHASSALSEGHLLWHKGETNIKRKLADEVILLRSSGQCDGLPGIRDDAKER